MAHHGRDDGRTLLGDDLSAGPVAWPARGWYPNGQLASEGSHAEDRQDGVWTYWYETGQVAARGRYRADRKVGVWEYWDKDGQPIEWGDWERRYMNEYDFACNDYTETPPQRRLAAPARRHTQAEHDHRATPRAASRWGRRVR